MKLNRLPIIPPPAYWSIGQSFLLVCPPARWDTILNQAYEAFRSSHFDQLMVGESGSVSIEEARNIRSESQKKPTQSVVRLCIIKHLDHSPAEAANALLKCLEEPAAATRFILLTETSRLPLTILSRCTVWKGFEDSKTEAELLPLEIDQDFGTVSVMLAEIVAKNQTESLIDQWTSTLLGSVPPRLGALHWLVEMRQLFGSSPVNRQAFLELTYLAIKHDWPLPASINRILSTSYGHI